MARKANDLLDIFRLSDERDQAEAAQQRRGATRPKRKASKAKPKARAPRGGAESVVLSKRHLLLAGSVVALLLALTFVLGIATGTDDAPDRPKIQKNEPTHTWYVRGRLPHVEWTNSQPIDIRSVVKELRERHGVKKEMISARRTSEHYILYLGPFDSEDDAHSYLEIRAIDGFNEGGLYPFSRPDIVKVKRRR